MNTVARSRETETFVQCRRSAKSASRTMRGSRPRVLHSPRSRRTLSQCTSCRRSSFLLTNVFAYKLGRTVTLRSFEGRQTMAAPYQLKILMFNRSSFNTQCKDFNVVLTSLLYPRLGQPSISPQHCKAYQLPGHSHPAPSKTNLVKPSGTEFLTPSSNRRLHPPHLVLPTNAPDHQQDFGTSLVNMLTSMVNLTATYHSRNKDDRRRRKSCRCK